jgi:hypothetical protein
MSRATKDILKKVADWPAEDQEELAELAREIEARRTGDYVLNDDERAAIEDARQGEVATADEVEAVFAKHRGA